MRSRSPQTRVRPLGYAKSLLCFLFDGGNRSVSCAAGRTPRFQQVPWQASRLSSSR